MFTEKKYKSKAELSIFLFLAFGLLSAATVMLINDNRHGLIVIVLIILFVTYLYFDTSYTVTVNGKLKIRGGFLINREVDIESIKKIKATNNPLSAPAFSMDRLEIFYNKYDTILISPKDENEFIQQLKQFNPAILIEL